ncbi:MAG TPA: hypothetical protein PKK00_12920 [Bacteroidales bacterium]|nr:hypothetical protein [Bacteroidales bacterium]HPS18137.1 hypothetical protein [Bacteroidales bacterium]
MKKIFLTLLIAVISICVFAQNNSNQQNQQQQQQQQRTPDMQKDTVALFQGRFGGPIKSEDAVKGDSIWLNKGGLIVVGFSMVYWQDTTMKKLDAKNNKLTSEMKTVLQGLKAEKRFVFANIRISGSDGVVRKPTFDVIEMVIEKQQ